MCCDCTALIWNIHLTCEVLCCHLPCVNSMASIIEGLGRGRSMAPALCPVWWPKATWSVWAEITSWQKWAGPERLPINCTSPLSDSYLPTEEKNTDLSKTFKWKSLVSCTALHDFKRILTPLTAYFKYSQCGCKQCHLSLRENFGLSQLPWL